jgi:hypothetical protein
LQVAPRTEEGNLHQHGPRPSPGTALTLADHIPGLQLTDTLG